MPIADVDKVASHEDVESRFDYTYDDDEDVSWDQDVSL